MFYLELRPVELWQTADIYSGHKVTGAILANAEWSASAYAAKVMLDGVSVKRVCAELFLRSEKPQLFPRHEPKQITLPTAMRAIAFYNLLGGTLDFK